MSRVIVTHAFSCLLFIQAFLFRTLSLVRYCSSFLVANILACQLLFKLSFYNQLRLRILLPFVCKEVGGANLYAKRSVVTECLVSQLLVRVSHQVDRILVASLVCRRHHVGY